MESLIAHHLDIVEATVDEFESAVSDAVDSVVSEMSAYLMRTIEHQDGAILMNPHNSEAILTLPEVFSQALAKSDYHASIVAFVSMFSDQVSYFSALYAEDRAAVEDLPEMSMLPEDKQVLVDHVAGSVMSLESPGMLAQGSMRMLAARSLGVTQLSELVRGVSEVVQRIKRVRPIAFDQLMIFFRMVGNSVYRSVESQDMGLLYSYVGPMDGTTTKRCSEIPRSRAYTRQQVEFLLNDDGNGMLINGGHVCCRHWWRAIAAVGTRTTTTA